MTPTTGPLTEPQLRAIIDRYLTAVSPADGFYDPAGRWDCHTAAEQFNGWVLDHYPRLDPYRISLMDPTFEVPAEHGFNTRADVVSHSVSYLSGWSVDFTYFQFDAAHTHPRVTRWEDLQAEWLSGENMDTSGNLHGWH